MTQWWEKDKVVNEQQLTVLSSNEEKQFQGWYSNYAKTNKLNLDPNNPLHYYDYRGFYKKYKPSMDFRGYPTEHTVTEGKYRLPDEFKLMGHPNPPEEENWWNTDVAVEAPILKPEQAAEIAQKKYEVAQKLDLSYETVNKFYNTLSPTLKAIYSQKEFEELWGIKRGETKTEFDPYNSMLFQAGDLAKRFVKGLYNSAVANIINRGNMGQLQVELEAYRQAVEEEKRGVVKPETPVAPVEVGLGPFKLEVQPTANLKYTPEQIEQAKQAAAQKQLEIVEKAPKVVPSFEMQAAANLKEKITDVASGLTAFIMQLGVAKQIMPDAPAWFHWEMVTQANGGAPGEGIAMSTALSTIGAIPSKTVLGKIAKLGTESTLFGGLAALGGADTEDIVIQALIPEALAGVRAVKGIVSTKKTPIQEAATEIITKSITEPVAKEVIKPEVKPAAPVEAKPKAAQPAEAKQAWEIGKKFTYEKSAFGQPTPNKFEAYKVNIPNQPESDLVVYKVRGGWIIDNRKTGDVFRKGDKPFKKGFIYEGFDSPQEAIENYTKQQPANVLAEYGLKAEGAEEFAGREAGFAYIPPVTKAGKVLEKYPNIEVLKSPKDIGIYQKYIGTSVNQARNTKNPKIIQAAEEMADTGLRIRNEITFNLDEDSKAFQSLPKEYRKNQGEKFFDLMDKYLPPEEIAKSKDIPDNVKPALKHFKEKAESMRKEIASRRVDMWATSFEKKSLGELQQAARDAGIEIKKAGKTKEIDRLKSEIAKDLAQIEVEKRWSKYQWGYIYHAFFGQYQLKYVDSEGVEHGIGRAENSAQAVERIGAWLDAKKAEGMPDVDKINVFATPEFNIPFDVVRLPRKQFFALQNRLAEASELEKSEIRDAVRGVIGQKATKQKFYGALLERKGATGYSKDFWRVWSAMTSQFSKWKNLTDMNKEVQPLIEEVKSQGLTKWSEHLEELKDATWGLKRTVASKSIDDMLSRIPIVQDYVKPFALERWSGWIKGANYLLHLQTPRFYAVNSFQPLQTLWPVVKEKGMYDAIKLYYSEEGKEILRKHQIVPMGGKLKEGFQMTIGRAGRWTPASLSESRNQGIAFLALYDKATKLGMPDVEAAKYARLRGQLFTQFAYTPSDVPKVMRGPVTGVMFQYKRFPIKSLELLGQLVRERDYGGVARWVAANTVIGGMKTLTKPIVFIPGASYIGIKIYNAIKEDYGETVADAVAYGLPGLAGIDLSGSVSLIEAPYGETYAEKLGNFMMGPTGQTLQRLARTLTEREVAKETGITGRLERTLIDSSPTAKQFYSLIQALEQDTAVYDSKERLLYHLSVKDLWKKVGAFRTTEESNAMMRIDAMLWIKEEYDKAMDKVVLGFLGEDYEGAITEVMKWEALYPEFPMTTDSFKSRVEAKIKSRLIPREERTFLTLPKPVKGAVMQEKKGED